MEAIKRDLTSYIPSNSLDLNSLLSRLDPQVLSDIKKSIDDKSSDRYFIVAAVESRNIESRNIREKAYSLVLSVQKAQMIGGAAQRTNIGATSEVKLWQDRGQEIHENMRNDGVINALVYQIIRDELLNLLEKKQSLAHGFYDAIVPAPDLHKFKEGRKVLSEESESSEDDENDESKVSSNKLGNADSADSGIDSDGEATEADERSVKEFKEQAAAIEKHEQSVEELKEQAEARREVRKRFSFPNKVSSANVEIMKELSKARVEEKELQEARDRVQRGQDENDAKSILSPLKAEFNAQERKVNRYKARAKTASVALVSASQNLKKLENVLASLLLNSLSTEREKSRAERRVGLARIKVEKMKARSNGANTSQALAEQSLAEVEKKYMNQEELLKNIGSNGSDFNNSDRSVENSIFESSDSDDSVSVSDVDSISVSDEPVPIENARADEPAQPSASLLMKIMSYISYYSRLFSSATAKDKSGEVPVSEIPLRPANLPEAPLSVNRR